MGTRNLTVIIKDNEIKLCQYGQWDGYFSVTGVKFLKFVKKNLQGRNVHTGKKKKRIREHQKKVFCEKVDLLKGINKKELDCMYKVSDKIGCSEDNKTEFVLPSQICMPQFSRDTGVEILNIINSLSTLDIPENKYFPVFINKDGIDWVEFINVINLDTDEIYMLTNHKFTGESLETCELVKKKLPMNCWYKSKIADIPTIKEVQKYKESIRLDYYQKENSGAWISY